MKTERRHELATNDLADWMGRHYETFIKPYGKVILGVVIAAAVLAGAWAFTRAQASSRSAQAFQELFTAISKRQPDVSMGFPSGVDAGPAADDLERIAPAYDDTAAGHWARAQLAEIQLGEGLDLLFTDRGEAQELLDKAIDNYQQALREARTPELEQYAHWGLARAYESKIDLDKAREHYQALVEEWPKGPYTFLAARRLEKLDNDQVLAFYDWFQQQETSPPADPHMGLGGGRPSRQPDPFPESSDPSSESLFESQFDFGDDTPDKGGADDSGADAKGADDEGTDQPATDAPSKTGEPPAGDAPEDTEAPQDN